MFLCIFIPYIEFFLDVYTKILKITLIIKTNPFVVFVFLQFEIQKIKQLLQMLMVCYCNYPYAQHGQKCKH